MKISSSSTINELTPEQLKDYVTYDEKTGIFTRKKTVNRLNKAGDRIGHNHSEGYRCISIAGKIYFEHRLAWLYVHGSWPNGTIDHINRNRSDNRISNLREASYTENNHNKTISKNNTSGCPGVYWSRRDNKHRVQITVNRKNIYIGTFESKDEAVAARKSAEDKYYPKLSGGVHG